jgi:hypothetical protein
MKESEQSVSSSKIMGGISQKSNADKAVQSINDVEGKTLKQEVKSDPSDLVALARELAQLRSAMKNDASTADHDVAIGEIAGAEKAAAQGDEEGARAHLKSAGKWALDTSQKIGVGVAVAAIKSALGL